MLLWEILLQREKVLLKLKLKKEKLIRGVLAVYPKQQPFCDGSHRKEGKFKSLKYYSEESKDMYFCGCKMTKNPPFCDGSHSKP